MASKDAIEKCLHQTRKIINRGKRFGTVEVGLASEKEAIKHSTTPLKSRELVSSLCTFTNKRIKEFKTSSIALKYHLEFICKYEMTQAAMFCFKKFLSTLLFTLILFQDHILIQF